MIHEKADSSLIPHQFRLIFDFIIDSKKKLAIDSSNSNLSFNTLYIFDNNIAIYSLVDNQKVSDYSKFLVIKIESFCKETSITTPTQNSLSATSNNVTSASPMENSISYRQQSEKQILKQASTALINKLAHSSSSASLPVSPEQLQQLNKKKQASILTPLIQQEPFIRMTCYYLYINKNQSVSYAPSSSTSLASINLVNTLSNDLDYINKVIEESINLYKQEIFWDNLTLSMYSIHNMLNENVNNMTITSTTSLPIVFSVNSDELEQILHISQKVDILDLDPSLHSLLRSCFQIKEKIKNHLKFSFGRHYIYTQSNAVEYCILLINDELVRNFRLFVILLFLEIMADHFMFLSVFSASDWAFSFFNKTHIFKIYVKRNFPMEHSIFFNFIYIIILS